MSALSYHVSPLGSSLSRLLSLSVLLSATFLLSAPQASLAQPSNTTKSAPERASRPVSKRTERPALSTKQYEERMRQYLRSNNSSLTIYQVMNELLDDLLADVRDLRLDQASPLAIRGVALSPNLSPLFGQWVEGELTARLIQSSKLTLRYCTPLPIRKDRRR